MVKSITLKLRLPMSVILIYSFSALLLLGVGIWLANDLISSRDSILAERASLALQTSKFMSQQFGTTITATDYVLRDVTTKVTVAELESASSDPAVQKRLSVLASEKLSTLPGVFGLGLLDRRAIFVAAADEKLLGIQSNSKLHVQDGEILENKTYVEYVPASMSANKQPAILVSRPILSTDRQFQGGGLAAIMLSSTQDWITSFDIGKYDTVTMIDGDGILLASNPPKPDAIGKVLPTPEGLTGFSDLNSLSSFTTVSPLDGRVRIYGVSKVEDIPLHVIVGYDQVSVLSDWQQRVWQTLIGFIALLIMLGLVLRKHLEALGQRDEMQKLAVTDPMTGVANRRQLISSGEIEIEKAVRYKYPASILMVDIDHFKNINDTWGHPTGDRVIQTLAKTLVAGIRKMDVVGRFGGEEFVLVLPCTNSDDAYSLANRLRELIENSITVRSDSGVQISFTVSIGVAGLREDSASFDAILAEADQALYEAKNLGRNKVILAS